MSKNKRAESRARYHIRQQAEKRGWLLSHVSQGGNILEEQEVEDIFSDIGLEGKKPDFVFCLAGDPVMVVETKNDVSKIDPAINEAIAYANAINETGKYSIMIAVGVAGERDKGVDVVSRIYIRDEWIPLTSNGFELTNIPSKKELELALEANDGSTSVSIPEFADFIDAAIEISGLLRTAKIEAPLRPQIVGTLVTAMYDGSLDRTTTINHINNSIQNVLDNADDLADESRSYLAERLLLNQADYKRLANSTGRLISILKQLNVRAVINTDADFLGMFYEAFLRYGYDNNALGIVFTPRHITRMCINLTSVSVRDRVIDIACGTGGFLVSALDVMLNQAKSTASIDKVKSSITGFDTNPTVWALAMLNMFFRGDGKSQIVNESSLLSNDFKRGYYTRAYLNPPFSQKNEPESIFIDRSMEALEPEGILATVVKAGIFADNEHSGWRQRFLKQHRVLALISLPEDLFYPTAAPTSIMIAQAHIPHASDDDVFLARIWNDGYEKLKGKRVPVSGSQIPEILEAYNAFEAGHEIKSNLVTVISGNDFIQGNEWSPQEWLPQPQLNYTGIAELNNAVALRIFQAVSNIPDLASMTLENFGDAWSDLPQLPYNTSGKLSDYFTIYNGKSTGEKNYADGDTPYISSGDPDNSIVRLIRSEDAELFPDGGISVTAFGLACLQPWSFMARGNGGSAVRVLLPKYRMTVRELVYFCSEINAQRWRFFYARMAIKSRIMRLDVRAPIKPLPELNESLYDRITEFEQQLIALSSF